MSDLSHQGAFRLIYEPNRTEAEQAALQNHLRTCAECRQDAQIAGLFNNHLVLNRLPTRPSPQFTAVYMESAARRSRRSHIMKPIYAVGGLAALALFMLAGWFIIRNNIQTTGLVGAPELPAISVSEPQATAQPAVAVESKAQPDTDQQEIDMAMMDENLVTAITANDAAEVARLLEAGANPNFVAGNGDVPLPLAAGAGDLEIVQLLLDAGADVNSTMDGKTSTGFTMPDAPALFHAAATGHLDVVDLLLANGANPNKTETAVGVTPLHEAARMNDVEIVQVLLANGADVNLRGTRGDTPLQWAALSGSIGTAEALLVAGADVNNIDLDQGLTPLMASLTHGPIGPLELVTLLLDHGTNPDVQDKTGNSALHYAAFDGDSAIVEDLLAGGASIDLQNNGGRTALHRAAVGNRAQVVKVLIAHGASLDIKDNEGHTPLDIATGESQELLREAGGKEAARGQTEAEINALDLQLIEAVIAGDSAEVERLLKLGGSPNAKYERGNAVLAKAARDGELNIVQLLLDAGANINSTGTFGLGENDPAISLAANYNHLPIVELLIARGAEIDKPDSKYGVTALGAAAYNNHVEVVRLLLENGADPNYRSTYLYSGSTPLHWVAGQGGADTAELLLEFGADVDIQTDWGRTPLMVAASNSNVNYRRISVPFLIDHGADPNMKDEFGNTALHLATEHDASDVIDILLEGGAQIDAQNTLGETALHLAAQKYATRTLKVLIDQGASLNIENYQGQTPLDVAANDTIKELLREAGAGE